MEVGRLQILFKLHFAKSLKYAQDFERIGILATNFAVGEIETHFI